MQEDYKFLSTPSARRATCIVKCRHHRFFISIHALREEGDKVDYVKSPYISDISIHALREEGDVAKIVRSNLLTYFYPRPPRGGRQ